MGPSLHERSAVGSTGRRQPKPRATAAPARARPDHERPELERRALTLPPVTRPAGGSGTPVRRQVGLGRRLLAVDVVSSLVGWSAGAAIANGDRPLAAPTTGAGMVTVGVIATVACFATAGLYRPPVDGIRSGALGRLVHGTGLAAVAVIVWQGAVGDVVPRLVLGAVAAALVATVVARCGFDAWLISRRESGHHSTPVVVAGAAGETGALADLLRLNPEAGLHAAAVVGERPVPTGDRADGPPWMGGLEDTRQVVQRTGASGVLLAVNGLPSDLMNRLVNDLSSAGITVHLSTGLTGVRRERVQTLAICHEPVFVVGPPRRSVASAFVKRSCDVALACLLLVATAPLVALAAVLIKAHDGGPVFFRQVRIGRGGRPFALVKLRTMEVGAEARLADLLHRNERHGPLFKASDDPRVTPIGVWLRSTAVDELPQLVNVLTGRMSIVGPRPALPAEAAEFDDELQRRHSVRPGVTGLWQVEANHKASFDEYRRLDLFYVDNWTLGLDAAVVADTVQAIVRRVLRALRRPAPTAPAPVGRSPVPEPVEAGR